MCFIDKRKRNWIRKEDRVSDRVRPLGRVRYDGAGHHILMIRLSFYYHLLMLVVIDMLVVKFFFEQNKVDES